MNYYFKQEDIGKNWWEITPKEKRDYAFYCVSGNHEFQDVIEIEGKTYSCSNSQKDGEDQLYCVYEFSFKSEPEEVQNPNEIECPFCGAEQGDSWEALDYDERYECGTCGSFYSYEREVSVEYVSVPVQQNQEIISL